VTEFSTEGRLTVSVDDRSLRDARKKIEAAVPEVPATLEASAPGGGGRGSEVAARDRARMRKLTNEQIDLSLTRNDLLRQLVESQEQENELRARGGSGGAASAVGALALATSPLALGGLIASQIDFPSSDDLVPELPSPGEYVPPLPDADDFVPPLPDAGEYVPTLPSTDDLVPPLPDADDFVPPLPDPGEYVPTLPTLTGEDLVPNPPSAEEILTAIVGGGTAEITRRVVNRPPGGSSAAPTNSVLPPTLLPSSLTTLFTQQSFQKEEQNRNPIEKWIADQFNGTNPTATGTTAATGPLLQAALQNADNPRNEASRRREMRNNSTTVEANADVTVQGLTRREVRDVVRQEIQDQIARELNENPVGL